MKYPCNIKIHDCFVRNMSLTDIYPYLKSKQRKIEQGNTKQNKTKR